MGNRAIISDIHANWEAFQTVLEDIKTQDVEEILCLGDIIGYGPNPLECLDAAMSLDMSLMGNHEEAILYGAVGFNPKAKMAVDWTRDQLNREDEDPEVRNRRWEFLGSLTPRQERPEALYVHGSPRDPIREYVFPTDILDTEKISAIFEHIDSICFNGHTHSPGVLTEGGKFIPPRNDGFEYKLTDEKILVNVGSVGQPRDGDNRSCYLIANEEVLRFRRVEYDFETTVDKINRIDRLPEYLAHRLREGR